MRRNNKKTDDSKLINFLEGIEEECACNENKHEMDEDTGEDVVMDLVDKFQKKVDVDNVDQDLVDFINGKLHEFDLVTPSKFGEGSGVPNETKNAILSALEGDVEALGSQVGGPNAIDRIKPRPEKSDEQIGFVRSLMDYLNDGAGEEVNEEGEGKKRDLSRFVDVEESNPVDKDLMKKKQGQQKDDLSGKEKEELSKTRQEINKGLDEEGGEDLVAMWVDGKKEEVVRKVSEMTMAQGFDLADSIAAETNVDFKDVTDEFMALANKLGV